MYSELVFRMKLDYSLATSCVMTGTKYCAVQSISVATSSSTWGVTVAPTFVETPDVLWRKFMQCLLEDMLT